MRSRLPILFVATALAGAIACTLNPQPLPPGRDDESPGGSTGTSSSSGGSGAVPSEGGQDAGSGDGGMPADGTAPDAGDAGSDASDAGDAGDGG